MPQLNHRANQLAHYLKEQGVGPNILVALSVERSLESVIGILGILKAGGAYIPLDPTYPSERLSFMLDDSQAHILLTQQRLVAHLPQSQTKVVCLDSDWAEIGAYSTHDLEPVASAKEMAYVIYTSGSTENQKGQKSPTVRFATI